MDLSIILSFALVASLLVISPGPNGLLITKTVATDGKAAGFANVLGFVTAFYIQGTMVVFGLAVLLVQSAALFTMVKIVGAAYLCWIGFKALKDAWRNKSVVKTEQQTKSKALLRYAYLEGLLTNALNPKTSMFYLAIFPQFLPIEQMTAANVYSLVTVHVMLNSLWFCGMVLVLGKLKALTSSGRVQRWIKGVTGFVFIGFGLKLATLRN
ncbi:MAG: MFS transporter [Hyphomicrobiales bacterium]|nr:MAG: MFS transporter [Hyphomicrobiales bacterium]